MTPTKLRAIRKRLGLTQRQFAGLLGVHEVTVGKWEAGMQAIRRTHGKLIELIAAGPKRRTR